MFDSDIVYDKMALGRTHYKNNLKNMKAELVRINSRITKAQHKFTKEEAKRLNISEGEMHRTVFQYYINNINKK